MESAESVTVPAAVLDSITLEILWSRLVGIADEVRIKLMATGGIPELAIYESDEETRRERTALKGRRPVYLPETGAYVSCAVYERNALTAGTEISGPAIIEERESTAVLGSGSSMRVLPGGHLLVELSGVPPEASNVIREDLQAATSNRASKLIRAD